MPERNEINVELQPEGDQPIDERLVLERTLTRYRPLLNALGSKGDI